MLWKSMVIAAGGGAFGLAAYLEAGGQMHSNAVANSIALPSPRLAMTRRLPGCAVDRDLREMAELAAHARGVSLTDFVRLAVADAVRTVNAGVAR